VAAQQNPDGFSAHLRDQFPFHRFLGNQPHCPPRLPCGRLAAHHGNNPLFIRAFQQLPGSSPLTLIQSAFQPAIAVAMRDPAYCLRRQMDDLGYSRGGLARRKLLQGNGPEHHPNLLDSSRKDRSNGLLILPRHLKLDGAS
jgi:hypothetical protein